MMQCKWYVSCLTFIGISIVCLSMSVKSQCTIEQWSVLNSSDTLTLFLKQNRVGTLMIRTTADLKSNTISSFQQIQIATSKASSAGSESMNIIERRLYDCNGSLLKANQTLTAQTGASSWEISQDSTNNWIYAVATGGAKQSKKVPAIKENLSTSLAIRTGILKRSLYVGQVWYDTIFDMTTGKQLPIKVTCKQIPLKPMDTYVFVNTVQNHDEQWETDTTGKLLSQQVQPLFVAKAESLTGNQKVESKVQEPVQWQDIAELFKISMERAPLDNECIGLIVKPGVMVHKTVASLYQNTSIGVAVLRSFPAECSDVRINKSLNTNWLRSTPIVQASHNDLKTYATQLQGLITDPCSIIKKFTLHLFSTLTKKNVATFSNALETLKAGYGDCGEHAALCTALLRSIGIESNIVLGLVYIPEKKGFYYHAWVVIRMSDKSMIFADPALGVVPVLKGYIPLVIDDDGSNLRDLAGMMSQFTITYTTCK